MPAQWTISGGAVFSQEVYFELLYGLLAESQAVGLKADTLSHSVSALFVAQIKGLPDVERVFWRRESTRIRVWTVIDQPDVVVEDQIYKAQSDLMDLLPEYSFDFSVIFRQGKPHDQISPRGAVEAFTRI
jgi:hypothetical protein